MSTLRQVTNAVNVLTTNKPEKKKKPMEPFTQMERQGNPGIPNSAEE